MSEREERFERMLAAVRQEYAATVCRMEKLRAEDKVKTVTFRQLMGNKLTLEMLLDRYRSFGLIDRDA